MVSPFQIVAMDDLKVGTYAYMFRKQFDSRIKLRTEFDAANRPVSFGFRHRR